jgi:Ca2+-transporting ATPase
MAFAVMAFGTLMTGLAVRRDPDSGLGSPRLKALGILAIPVALTVLATVWPVLQRLVGTQPLTGSQWIASFLLASIVLVVVEGEKWVRRRRST